MWSCAACSTEVDDRFEHCPNCGTGRDGSAAPAAPGQDEDGLQNGRPEARPGSKLISISIVIAVIIVLLVIAFY